MLVLTESATSVIRKLVDSPELPDGAGLRIATADENTEQLTVSPVPTPEAGDQVIENSGARVFLERDAVATLENLVLDAHVNENGRVKFQLVPQ